MNDWGMRMDCTTPSRKRRNSISNIMEHSNHNTNGTATSSGGDGSPWQAMKRLRMGEHPSHSWIRQQQQQQQQQQPASSGVTEHYSSAPPAGNTKSHRPDLLLTQQKPPRVGSLDNHDTAKQQRHREDRTTASSSADLDYQTVNHILGNLHLERRQRHPPQPSLAVVLPTNQRQEDERPTARQPQSTAVLASRSSGQTASAASPGGGSSSRVRKMKHLYTSSNLG